MAELKEKRTVYYIPNNYIDEAKILQGRFKRRYFVEAVIFAFVMAMIGLMIPINDLKTRIVVVVMLAAPPFILGMVGYNGDPISVAAISAYRWLKKSNIVIYNQKPRPLTKNPLDAVLETEQMRDKIVDVYDTMMSRHIEKKDREEFLEGVNFEFSEDRYVNPYADLKAAEKAAERAKAKAEHEQEIELEEQSLEEILERAELMISSAEQGDHESQKDHDIAGLLDREVVIENDFDFTNTGEEDDWF